MSRASITVVISCAMLLPAITGSMAVSADPLSLSGADQDAPVSTRSDYGQIIAELESSEGAYAPELSESLLSLGLELQRQGRHREAIASFKRGVHLARINEGLYCTQQLPMLEREIISHLALGQYAKADERQAYLYRVQMRSIEAGPLRSRAFLQQAQWQYTAYRLDLDDRGFARLMSMWDLYRLALTDIIEQDGETSSRLLAPLLGMLRAQYLIADYDLEELQAASAGIDNFSVQHQVSRFSAYRAQSYKRGQAIIQSIYDIQKAQHGANSLETARTRAMLGDWMLWHGNTDRAMKAYREATAELTPRDDAEELMATLFAQPVELPDLEGAGRLPMQADDGVANLHLEFGVDRRGRVVDLERVDENDLNRAEANRIMRMLRKTQFRPRLAMGEPQATEGMTRAYEIQ